MRTYLFDNEINFLNKVKLNRLDLKDLKKVKDFFKKIGGVFVVDLKTNQDFIYDYFFQKHNGKMGISIWFSKYHNLFPNVNSYDWENTIFSYYFNEIEPEGYHIYKLCEKVDLRGKKEQVEEFIKKNTDIKDFPIDEFLLTDNFDFREFTEDAEKEKRKDEINNVEMVCKSGLYFFELLTKGLNDEQKEMLKGNLFVKLQYIIDNITLEDLKKKGDVFRNMLNYFGNEKG